MRSLRMRIPYYAFSLICCALTQQSITSIEEENSRRGHDVKPTIGINNDSSSKSRTLYTHNLESSESVNIQQRKMPRNPALLVNCNPSYSSKEEMIEKKLPYKKSKVKRSLKKKDGDNDYYYQPNYNRPFFQRFAHFLATPVSSLKGSLEWTERKINLLNKLYQQSIFKPYRNSATQIKVAQEGTMSSKKMRDDIESSEKKSSNKDESKPEESSTSARNVINDGDENKKEPILKSDDSFSRPSRSRSVVPLEISKLHVNPEHDKKLESSSNRISSHQEIPKLNQAEQHAHNRIIPGSPSSNVMFSPHVQQDEYKQASPTNTHSQTTDPSGDLPLVDTFEGISRPKKSPNTVTRQPEEKLHNISPSLPPPISGQSNIKKLEGPANLIGHETPPNNHAAPNDRKPFEKISTVSPKIEQNFHPDSLKFISSPAEKNNQEGGQKVVVVDDYTREKSKKVDLNSSKSKVFVPASDILETSPNSQQSVINRMPISLENSNIIKKSGHEDRSSLGSLVRTHQNGVNNQVKSPLSSITSSSEHHPRISSWSPSSPQKISSDREILNPFSISKIWNQIIGQTTITIPKKLMDFLKIYFYLGVEQDSELRSTTTTTSSLSSASTSENEIMFVKNSEPKWTLDPDTISFFLTSMKRDSLEKEENHNNNNSVISIKLINREFCIKIISSRILHQNQRDDDPNQIISVNNWSLRKKILVNHQNRLLGGQELHPNPNFNIHIKEISVDSNPKGKLINVPQQGYIKSSSFPKTSIEFSHKNDQNQGSNLPLVGPFQGISRPQKSPMTVTRQPETKLHNISPSLPPPTSDQSDIIKVEEQANSIGHETPPNNDSAPNEREPFEKISTVSPKIEQHFNPESLKVISSTSEKNNQEGGQKVVVVDDHSMEKLKKADLNSSKSKVFVPTSDIFETSPNSQQSVIKKNPISSEISNINKKSGNEDRSALGSLVTTHQNGVNNQLEYPLSSITSSTEKQARVLSLSLSSPQQTSSDRKILNPLSISKIRNQIFGQTTITISKKLMDFFKSFFYLDVEEYSELRSTTTAASSLSFASTSKNEVMFIKSSETKWTIDSDTISFFLTSMKRDSLEKEVNHNNNNSVILIKLMSREFCIKIISSRILHQNQRDDNPNQIISVNNWSLRKKILENHQNTLLGGQEHHPNSNFNRNVKEISVDSSPKGNLINVPQQGYIKSSSFSRTLSEFPPNNKQNQPKDSGSLNSEKGSTSKIVDHDSRLVVVVPPEQKELEKDLNLQKSRIGYKDDLFQERRTLKMSPEIHNNDNSSNEKENIIEELASSSSTLQEGKNEHSEKEIISSISEVKENLPGNSKVDKDTKFSSSSLVLKKEEDEDKYLHHLKESLINESDDGVDLEEEKIGKPQKSNLMKKYSAKNIEISSQILQPLTTFEKDAPFTRIIKMPK